MSKKEFTVFISCPGDVSGERQVAEQAVNDFSKNLPNNPVSFKVFHFGHVISEFGGAPQDIVNEQLPDFDIYIGIMGAKFGTPTPRYKSGTQEEFYDALKLHEENGKVHVSFLFKSINTPVKELAHEDIENFLKVKNFQKEMFAFRR